MTRRLPESSSFTLIELLIVISIISILALIAIPNFLEAQTRSKVSRAQSDMADLAAALRVYCADYNAYPPNRPELRAFFVDCANGVTPPSSTVVAHSGFDLVLLTTPVAYHSGVMPLDPFSRNYVSDHKSLPFFYVNILDITTDTVSATGAYRRFILGSPGPDLVISAPHPVRGPFIPYDPSNGTISEGDIYRFGW
ncbi:MAG: prepilin-type N-terminal cleavage/methylation domain-containing protein [Candidatus Sumerlaeota bacterium]|nr:prepilin-type N-terminal cleavage/methylation domain-containing protein [Candidatus Sumerlaeota bacterium]